MTCAVSGGADSLALMVLAVAAGCRVTAVHVDHGLRPGSAAESEVVGSAAERLGAAFRAERVTVASGPNLEARARAARLAALPADVATGHTMDDQAETVLINLLRGAAGDGLAGMRPGPRHPLLGLRRVETQAVCEAMGFEWVRDPSNEDPRHLRNRVRGELLPLCEALARRDPVPVLARQAALLRSESSLLDALAAEAVPDPTDARAVASAPPPLARRALRAWLRTSGGPAGPGAAQEGTPPTGAGGGGGHPPSSAAVDRVLAVATGRAAGTELEGGRRVRRSAGRLSVDPLPGVGGEETQVGAQTDRRAASVKVWPVQTEAADLVAPEWAVPSVGPVVVSAEAIAERVRELGERITADYADDPPLLVGVLKGAMTFMSDLCRVIELPVDLDFMAVSSYGSATRTSGVVRIVKDLDAELTDRRVLVVEDIIDSGLTLNYLRKYLHARSPASVDVCALLVKEGQQRVHLDLRYVGFTIPSEFVVGYGLDVGERYRNLTGVHSYLGTDPSGRPPAGR
jgi:tRNA(Ile)-lysidine synthase